MFRHKQGKVEIQQTRQYKPIKQNKARQTYRDEGTDTHTDKRERDTHAHTEKKEKKTGQTDRLTDMGVLTRIFAGYPAVSSKTGAEEAVGSVVAGTTVHTGAVSHARHT